MSLYRKYRPKDFPGLIGQEHIKTTLLNAIRAGKISHAYLFTGPRGTGKTTTARLLAKAINAETMTEDGRFDGSEIAEEIDRGRLIDVIEIDAASNRGIDEIRDLREKISYAPTRAKNKVYIIDEVHMLTKEAFNALLKTLEEPPSFVYFILATTEIQKVPETIMSRCQRFDFRRISESVLIEHMRQVAEIEGIKTEDEALQIIARHARGGARDALTLLEQITSGGKLETARVKEVLGISHMHSCDTLFAILSQGGVAEAMDQLQTIFQSGVDLVQFNRDFLDYLRQQMLTSVKQGDRTTALRMIELIGFFQEAYEKQKFSYIPELPLEVAIAKSCLGVPRSAPVNAAQTLPSTDNVKVIPTAIPVHTSPPSAGLDGLLQNWGAVLDRIHNPLARRCLMAGKPVEISGNNLVLAFQNNFNKDKLFVPELLAVVEEAIETNCNLKLKLVGRVDPALAAAMDSAELPTSQSTGDSDAASASSGAPAQKDPAGSQGGKPEDLVESALNVFGGEVVK